MGQYPVDEVAVDAVLAASRTLIAVATRSLGAAAEETTIAQYRALVVLASRGPQRVGDLALALGVTASTAGRMCDRLLRKDLIRRSRTSADRRAVRISITPAGRRVVDQATARRRVLIGGILGRLSPADQSAAASALRAFAVAAGEIPDSQWPAEAASAQSSGDEAAPPAAAGELGPAIMTGSAAAGWARDAGRWLRGSRAGLAVTALAVGAGSGLGAIAFRYLIYFLTWLATGHVLFGQQGRIGSSHLPWLGLGFFVVIPVIGGLLYGPLIHRYAREARGHGVPEVMIAVADQGGRIRPQVSLVKALASALCIGAGGSVGREGPIVQIGAALASSLGQLARMPENRMRTLVACGAAGGIAATFNAPVTGVFFAAELILRELSAETVVAVMLSAMAADVISRAFLGNAPVFAGFPAGIGLHSTASYLLVAALAIAAALTGLAFKTVLYKTEDICNRIWADRPEWARPAVGGAVLGLLLLALPQLYGVGYPVMLKAADGNYALWFLIILAAGKIIAASLTIGIGGSGGVFAPSLFIGATSGMAFGEIASRLLGPAAGQPALYAVIAMGAVFASASRAPLTSLASVVEMTGDYTLTVPVMLAVAVATVLSRTLTYGTIYTTKLLRRGTDIDHRSSADPFGNLTAADAMRPFSSPLPAAPAAACPEDGPDQAPLPGPVTRQREPQPLLATESLAHAMRQLVLYGRDGLPVLSPDGKHLLGWITSQNAIQAITRQISAAAPKTAAQASPAAQRSARRQASPSVEPNPLRGYQILEVTITGNSPITGKTLSDVTWPHRCVPVSVLDGQTLRDPEPGLILGSGDRINLLVAVSP